MEGDVTESLLMVRNLHMKMEFKLTAAHCFAQQKIKIKLKNKWHH